MSEEDKDLPIEIYEEDVKEEPSLDLNGEVIREDEDILEGIDLEKEVSEASVKSDYYVNKPDTKEVTEDNVLTVVDDSEASIPDSEISNNSNKVLSININQNNPLQRHIEDPVRTNTLCKSIKNNQSTTAILNNIMAEIAEESAYLKQWSRENYNLKDDYSDISNKRMMMLKKLVETIEKREKINIRKSSGNVDFHSEGFQKVFSYFLNVVRDTFNKVNIPSQYDEIFFHQLAKNLDGFESTAEKIYQGKKVKK